MRKKIGLAAIIVVATTAIMIIGNTGKQQNEKETEEREVLKRIGMEGEGAKRSGMISSRVNIAIGAIASLSRENKMHKQKGEERDEFDEFVEMAPLFFDELLFNEAAENEKEAELIEEGNEYLLETGNEATEIVEISCSETLCRIELAHEDEIAYDKFHKTESRHCPWDGTQLGVVDENDDGRILTRIYNFGHGEGFPMSGYEEYKRENGLDKS